MKVTLEKREKNQVSLAVEVEGAAVDSALERAYRTISRQVMIPGFRKGKAPRPLVERHVGTDALTKEALEMLVPETYTKAIEESKLEPITQPQLLEAAGIEKGKPAIFKYLVEVRPDVTLGTYLAIKVSPPGNEVPEAKVTEAIESLRSRQATFEVVEREIREGDAAVLDFEGKVDGVAFEGGKATNYTIECTPGRFIPGFVEALYGVRAGESKSADLEFPAEYASAELAGKKTTFDMTVKEVKERKLPELDDELAKQFGAESKADLKAKVREQIQTQADEAQEVEGRKQMLEQIVETAEMDISETMIKREIYFLLDQHFGQIQKQGVDVSKIFTEETRTEWEQKFEPEATKRIRTSLTLGAIARKESIEVTAEEVGEAIVEYAQMLNKDPHQFQQELISNGRYAALADEVLSNKIIEWLYERADVEASRSERSAGEAGRTVDKRDEFLGAPTETPAKSDESEVAPATPGTDQ